MSCPHCKTESSYLIDNERRKCCLCETIYPVSQIETKSLKDMLFHEIWTDHNCEIIEPNTGEKIKGSIARCDTGQYYFRPDYVCPPWYEIPLNSVVKCETLREELIRNKMAELAEPIENMTLQELIKNDS